MCEMKTTNLNMREQITARSEFHSKAHMARRLKRCEKSEEKRAAPFVDSTENVALCDHAVELVAREDLRLRASDDRNGGIVSGVCQVDVMKWTRVSVLVQVWPLKLTTTSNDKKTQQPTQQGQERK
jgi:hypothetical protein